MEFFIKDLRISPLEQEIFGFTRRTNFVLYDLIKSGNFKSESAIKIRRVKRIKSYEVLTGADVFTVLQRLAAESTYPQNPITKINCEVIELTDEEAVAIMLYEAVYMPPSYSQFSQFQFYFYSLLYSKFSSKPIQKKNLQKLLHTGETSYQNLQTCVRFALEKLKTKYPDALAEINEKHTGDELRGKLIELKLIEHAVKQNEWTDFSDFFSGKMKISHFYRRVYKKNNARKTEEKVTSEKIFVKTGKLLAEMKSLSAELDELTLEERHVLNKLYGRDFQYFVSLITPEKPARKTSKTAGKTSDGELFSND